MKKHMELKNKSYTMIANVSADCIKALKRWNKESGKRIAEAIQTGNVKLAIQEMQNASSRNRQIREMSANHDKLIYDANGKLSFCYDCKDDACYAIEE